MREVPMLAVKICGLTTLEDARCAVEEGATYLGFVLYRGSPRCVTPRHLGRILDRLPQGVRAVGVFVNETPSVVASIAADHRLFAVQLHGDEDPAAFGGLPVPLWRAVRYREGRWTPDPAAWAPELYVMDAATAAYGGSGVRVEECAAAAFARGHRALLAGGLDPANVAAAVRRVRPAGVDVSSGVEVSPGRKDHAKVAAFIRAARRAVRAGGGAGAGAPRKRG